MASASYNFVCDEISAADILRWIVFNPNNSTENFQSWIVENKPSQISCDDGISWISVVSPSKKSLDVNLIGLLETWDQLQASGRPINKQTITDIAKAYNSLCGKWMFFPKTGPKVDYLWEKIATAVVSGSVQSCISAKVSPYEPDSKDQSHVLLIYNQDFTDNHEVYSLENSIRSLGVKARMCYKPDTYTYMGIYRSNPWGLRPILYESVFDILYGGSKITEL